MAPVIHWAAQLLFLIHALGIGDPRLSATDFLRKNYKFKMLGVLTTKLGHVLGLRPNVILEYPLLEYSVFDLYLDLGIFFIFNKWVDKLEVLAHTIGWILSGSMIYAVVLALSIIYCSGTEVCRIEKVLEECVSSRPLTLNLIHDVMNIIENNPGTDNTRENIREKIYLRLRALNQSNLGVAATVESLDRVCGNKLLVDKCAQIQAHTGVLNPEGLSALLGAPAQALERNYVYSGRVPSIVEECNLLGATLREYRTMLGGRQS